MSLDDLPAGACVLLDANIVIYAQRGASAQCRRLLERCAGGDLDGCLTTLGVAEFCHRRMMQEAQSLGLAGPNPAKALSQNPGLLRQLSQYRLEVEDLLAGELRILPVEPVDFPTALKLQSQHALLTNDSLLVAVALRLGLQYLATADQRFPVLPGLTVCQPDDLA